jgi:hypothetical protein
MTLSVRNNFFRAGIILAVLSLCLTVVGGYFAFSAFPRAGASAALRSGGFIQFLLGGITRPADYVPLATMLGSVVFSLVSTILILHYFEKTQTPEILFIGLFVISLSLEFIRIAAPLKMVFSFSSFYLITASRILIFGRFFGLFSLFAASVYSAGLDMQRQRNILIVMVPAALVIALNVPIDGLIWDTSLKMLNGYNSMLTIVETGIFAVTVISFFISAYTRGSKTYVFIGIGAFLAFTGRNILIRADNWITPLPGLLILAAGVWFICARLHEEYLWL